MKPKTYKAIMAVVTLILLFGVAVGEASTNLVTNPGFETPETIGPSLPTTFGDWEGDTQTIVGAESGITPIEGSRMLKFLGGGTFADVWQLVDLSSFSTEIATGMVNFQRLHGSIALEATTSSYWKFRHSMVRLAIFRRRLTEHFSRITE